MQNTIELKPSDKKDHYNMVINGARMGEWEVSDLRHLIEVVDSKLPWRRFPVRLDTSDLPNDSENWEVGL